MAFDFSKDELDNTYELYKIEFGSEAWHYTSSDKEIAYAGKSYSPASIKRGELTKNTEMDSLSLEITVPLTEMILNYVTSMPVGIITVTIYMYQAADAVIMAYKGLVSTVTLQSGNIAVISLEDMREMTIRIPRYVVAPSCQHYLYDARCGLNKEEWKIETTVVDIGGNGVVIELDLPVLDDDYLSMGYLERGDDVRVIFDHAMMMIHLQEPLLGLEVGHTVTVYPGCTRSYSICRDKFDNLENFLGSPLVPRKNPVLKGF